MCLLFLSLRTPLLLVLRTAVLADQKKQGRYRGKMEDYLTQELATLFLDSILLKSSLECEGRASEETKWLNEKKKKEKT